MKRRDGAKERFWRQTLKAQGRSGLTVRAYCHREGLAEASFYFWKQELARRGAERGRTPSPRPSSSAPAVFAEVKVGATVDADQRAAIEIVLAHGRRVRVLAGFDLQTLRQGRMGVPGRKASGSRPARSGP